MLGFLTKLFGGHKSDRDIRTIQPMVKQINEEYSKLQSLPIDTLRNKTQEFRQRIQAHLAAIDAEIATQQQQADDTEDVAVKESVYQEIDKLKKDRDKQTEDILEQLLPEAFAVVKETARRLSESSQITATATELDRQLAVRKPYLRIEGDKVTWNNRWQAAGNEVTWNMVHYDVQLIGGTVLHQGKIAEMATGEGKTLVSTLPAYLNALAGQGVHIVTVNDYLARRDSEWNGPLFEFLGITVDCIDKHQPNSAERRNAYLADITYGTNNEFGFDYLRDNMVHNPEEMVQRKHHYAMVDEVDSVLIDDARTPLIISGPIPRGEEQEFHILKPRIQRLVDAQKKVTHQYLLEAKKLIGEGKDDPKTGGLALMRAWRGLPKSSALIKYLSEPGIKVLLQKAENYYLADQQREMPKVDEELYFHIDEKNNSVDLTEKGIALITQAGEDPNFFIMPDVGSEIAEIERQVGTPEEKLHRKDQLLQEFAIKSDRIHSVQQLLKAYTLFENDVEYVVMDGKVKIVDEQTGRILEGRRYSDGLHQAIEAKENVKVEAATQTFATVTLQNYFRMYHKLAGMTGTAVTEAGEFWEIYKLDVVTIPTNLPITRKDAEDLVYKTKRDKYKAVIEEVKQLQAQGRPVLVGTTSVEVSELLGKMLTFEKIPHNVLNAKQHAREAQIVAEAGMSGAVTIATNMAGRGTDIKLGPGVKEAGGLAIIGTERHESRRVDRQLRGRAGRQGDPGSSQFFVSLEDDLMRMFGSDRIASLMDRMGYKEGEVIQHSMITRSIERAQKKVEENNFGIRKRLLEYDDVMNKQRTVIYSKRNHALFGDRLAIDIDNAFYDVAESIITTHRESGDYEAFKMDVIMHFSVDSDIAPEELAKGDLSAMSTRLYHQAKSAYERKGADLTANTLPVIKQIQQEQGHHIENISIPFTDGKKGINVLANLQKVVATEGKETLHALERSITLALIDESWKEHLRAMDDLKQSVQSAVYEQKDPLLIYKFEAFNLFKQMDGDTSREIVSFLCKSGIPVSQDERQQEEQLQIREGHEEKTDMSGMRASHQEFDTAPVVNNGHVVPEEELDFGAQAEAVRQDPVRVGPKVGRNDPCPCGSGKKYKQCHGKDL
ncbi:preprotein translocase subunit SecA [Chitinophaga pendula]|uniref:preprotein translocase subunit SecA n=1 Tax=Chitinophaga TaxID=79328 RepID=UPI000BB059B0|nr:MULTISPECIES: preprotein translocase subunit SecA [Chitinophaga]ASZ09786.1 preprotein translocase subunit SecA [Chitinophaga sp. MD30]UCJ07274.1 preprotein translocase subunit SecA [Chitinophaga pendula]